jgi:hypothetical protein
MCLQYVPYVPYSVLLQAGFGGKFGVLQDRQDKVSLYFSLSNQKKVE